VSASASVSVSVSVHVSVSALKSGFRYLSRVNLLLQLNP